MSKKVLTMKGIEEKISRSVIQAIDHDLQDIIHSVVSEESELLYHMVEVQYKKLLKPAVIKYMKENKEDMIAEGVKRTIDKLIG